MRARLICSATMLGALIALSPHSMQAQLGRIKKVVDLGKAAGVNKDQTPAKGSVNDYSLTAERIDAVLGVIEPQLDRLERESAAKVAAADYEKRAKVFSDCATNVASKGAIPSAATMQRTGPTQQRMSQLGIRMGSAQQAGHYLELVAAQDTMGVLSAVVTLMMQDAEAKCPKPVYKPLAVLEVEASMRESNIKGTRSGSTDVSVPVSARGGMTYQQFGMVRERVSIWALQQTGAAPVGDNKYSVFTADEQTALSARAVRVKRMAPLLKDGTLKWTTWGDVTSW